MKPLLKVIAASIALSGALAGCVIAPAPGAVWVPAHYNAYGYWVPGHYR